MTAIQWMRDDGGSGSGPSAWRRPGEVRRADAPVYAALADQWRSAGRMVPGQTDAEWTELVGRVPRLTGV